MVLPRAAIEHQPEPDERLADVVFFDIDVAVVLGLKRDVLASKHSACTLVASSLARVACLRAPWGRPRYI